MKITEYKIVYDLSPRDMTNSVNHYLRLGWTIRGHTKRRTRDCEYYTQTMVKYDESQPVESQPVDSKVEN